MIDVLNNHKLFLGIMLILVNVGSRHFIDELSEDPKVYERNLLLRRIAIFAVCFVGTRDLVYSLLLTAGFIIIASGMSSRSREGYENVPKKEKMSTAHAKDKPLAEEED